MEIFIQFASAVWNSAAFSVIKFILGVYAAVLFMDIVMILILFGTGEKIKKLLHGADLPPAHKKEVYRRWKKIQNRLDGESVSQWKVAIIEADAIADEMLVKAGLSGENMADRLEKATMDQVAPKDALLAAHEVRNKIIRDETFVLDKKTAEKSVEVFGEFLKSWEAL